MLRKSAAAFLVLALISACSTIGAGINHCSIFEPILISQDDVLTEETAEQILEHNLIWQNLCP